MKALKLIAWLRTSPNTEVVIYDPATDDTLPIDRVEMKYGQPIVLHPKGDRDAG